MDKFYIIIGSDVQIDCSKLLSFIVASFNDVVIIPNPQMQFKTLHDQIFKPQSLVLVYNNNNTDFDYYEFYLNRLSNKQNVTFVFFCRKNPFETTTPLSSKYEVINIADTELLPFPDNNLSLHRIYSQINHLLKMVEDTELSEVFSKAEKSFFTDYYKKRIMQLHVARLNYSNNATKEILSTIKK